MIGLLLLAQVAGGSAQSAPDLVELSGIVAPYAVCESKRAAEMKAAFDSWLPAEQLKRREPTNTQAAAEATKQSDRLQALKAEIRTTCGYDATHERLRKRLITLHPKMDEARAFWLARTVFSQLNTMNEQLLRLQAGIMPAAPPPPPTLRPAPKAE